MTTTDRTLRRLGVGVGYRTEIAEQILLNQERIDWVQIMTDHYFLDPYASEKLTTLAAFFPVILHGLEMSVGSSGPLDMAYVEKVAAVADIVDAPWVSDHLCFTREDGIELNNLTPVYRTRRRAAEVAAKVQRVVDRLGRPFLLENITYYVELGGELTEAEFITEVLEQCDAGLLLDVENVSINATNHGTDPYEFLSAIPLERVVEIHVAGGVQASDLRLDSHSAPVSDACLDLLSWVTARHPVAGVLLERDTDFPDDFAEILDDLSRIRAAIVPERTAR